MHDLPSAPPFLCNHTHAMFPPRNASRISWHATPPKATLLASKALPTAAIGAWRHTDKLMEDAAHVGVAREAAFERYFSQRHGRFYKQLACAFHSQVQNIFVWRVSGGSPKHPREVDGTVSALTRQRLEGQI